MSIEYTVTWAIQVDADDAEGAALEALKIQRDPDNLATRFSVTRYGNLHGRDPQQGIDAKPLLLAEQEADEARYREALAKQAYDFKNAVARLEEWHQEVREGNTRLGLEEWIEHQRESLGE